MTYRLDIFGTSASDVVRFAGGWVFDHAMAGWDVTVMVDAPEDRRALHILGAKTLNRKAALTVWAHDPYPHTLALSAEHFSSDWRLRRTVLQAIDSGFTDLILWGDRRANEPSQFRPTLSTVDHRLSSAARAFKREALSALKPPTREASSVEIFHRASRPAGKSRRYLTADHILASRAAVVRTLEYIYRHLAPGTSQPIPPAQRREQLGQCSTV